ncbi:MAG: hypothetical protein ACR2HR_09720 [Euzebya sp.]
MMATPRELLDELRPQRRASRLLYRGGGVWLTIGLAHVAVLAATGGEWSGAISWRKPIVFGISFGLMLVVVGWVLDQLPDRRLRAAVIAWPLLVSSSVEVGLITAQAWRGKASHFNVFGSIDTAIFVVMGAMAGVFSLCLLAVFIWALIDRPADPLVRIAVIGGLALMMTGLGVGQWLIQIGSTLAQTRNAAPDVVTYNSGGVPKFPHAVALHGIQVLIVAALMLRRTARSDSWRRMMMWLVTSSYVGVLVLSSGQAIAGQAPGSMSGWGVATVVSFLILSLAMIWIVGEWWTAEPQESQLLTIP